MARTIRIMSLRKEHHESVDFTQWSSNIKIVHVAVATTGFIGQKCQICQIAAKGEHEESVWSVNILPDKTFVPQAASYNHFNLSEKLNGHGRSLLKDGVNVQTVTLIQALEEFVLYVTNIAESNHTTILLGWNSQQFHMQLILKALKDCKLSFKGLEDAKICYGDPFLMIKNNREKFPKIAKLPCLKLPAIYNHLFGKRSSEAESSLSNDACQIIMMHQSVLTLLNITGEHLKEYTFTLSSAERVRKYRSKVNQNLESMEGPSKLYVQGSRKGENVITESMARKIAEGGLAYQDLKRIYWKSGREGIEWILKTPQHGDYRGQPRVTRSQRVIDAIVKHFEEKMACKCKLEM